MGVKYEYKSFMRTFNVGEEYVSADDVLADLGADGWQLVSVIVIRAKLEHEVAEVFYLQRQATVE